MKFTLIRSSGAIAMLAGVALIAAVASPAQATPSITASGFGTLLTPASISPVSLISGSNPLAVALTPNGQHAYVAEETADKVADVDTTTGTVVQITLTGTNPDAIAASPDGQFIYVADYLSAAVERINTSTDTLDGLVALGSFAYPTSIAVAPDGSKIFVVESGKDTVQEITASTFVSAGSVTGLPATAETLTVSPVGTTAWVAGGGSSATWAQSFNTSTLALGPKVNLATGSDPFDLAMSPDGATLYIAQPGAENVLPLTTSDDSLGAPVALGGAPDGVAVSPDGKTLYIALSFGIRVVSTSDLSGSLVKYTDNGQPYNIAVSPDGRRVYFADLTGGSLTAYNAVKATVSGPAQITPGAPTTTFTITIDDGNTPVGDYSADTAAIAILNSADTPVASQFGSFDATTGVATITVPTASIPDGKYTVEGAIEDTQTQALTFAIADPFVVGTLATTGTDVATPLTVGALLVLIGGAAFALTRRRRRVAS